MTPRPAIFISSVSKELRSARQLVANTLTFLGYEPVWQDIFGTEGGDLRDMLRQQLDQCKGVVQLVGQCYGAEPPTVDPQFGRVSYTQYEALYARQQGKKVWYLFIDKSFPIDAHQPEAEELRQLQAAYRGVLRTDTHLFHPLASREALEAGVLKLRDDLTKLRRSAHRWALLVLALLCLITGLSVWLLRGQRQTNETLGQTNQTLGKTNETLERIAARFETLAAVGGVIPDAKTPEEHYHNARIHELSGNFSAARKAYAEYLSFNLDALDPWLSYSAMLKAAEGKAGALEALRYFGDKLTPRTLAYQTALALMSDGDERMKQLTSLAAGHPEYGPLSWLISQEYSEARRGEQTLAEVRLEKEWLQKFRAAHAAGKIEKHFLDKKEALRWVETAETRWAKALSTPETVLENPVSISGMLSSTGWGLQFSLRDFKIKELWYRMDGAGEFISTGTQPHINPLTGLPMVNLYVPVPNLTPGVHLIEVKYLDQNNQSNGPYKLKFSTVEQELVQGKAVLKMTAGSWLAFRDFDGRVLLYFTGVLTQRSILKEIRYSLDSDALDREFKFKPGKTFEVGDDIYLAVPADSAFACIQLTFTDGTKSDVQNIVRQK